jgi:hypothetical protein
MTTASTCAVTPFTRLVSVRCSTVTQTWFAAGLFQLAGWPRHSARQEWPIDCVDFQQGVRSHLDERYSRNVLTYRTTFHTSARVTSAFIAGILGFARPFHIL